MAKVTYNRQLIALCTIDPYDDFISEGGKVWDRFKGGAEANNCVLHMRRVPEAARKTHIGVFYALHHTGMSPLLTRSVAAQNHLSRLTGIDVASKFHRVTPQ